MKIFPIAPINTLNAVAKPLTMNVVVLNIPPAIVDAIPAPLMEVATAF